MSDADSERMDSLDGWVAVKRDAFDDSESHKLRFIVEWNEIETKFAVTCHNRTLQRRGDASGSCAGLFSGEQLSGVGAHLSGVRDELGPLFPDLTRFREPSLWELLFSSAPRCDADAACRQLERYFGVAVDACGRKIVLDALFSVTEADEREYFENLQEFKCKAMRDEMTRAKDTLGALLQTHPSTDGLQRLMKIYEEEDETYRELVSVATKFYQNLLQPFRDMREIATLYKTEILKCLQYEELGPKRVSELEAEMNEWNQRGEKAVHSIQDITADYFRDTSRALTGMVKQMEQDQKRFGHASWAMATPRQEKLRVLLAKETLQYMRAKEMCIKRKRDEIREKMRGVTAGGSEAVSVIRELELQYYETQLELHDCRFEILRNEELLLLTQIKSTRRQIRELQEQVVYYDTCEDPEELQDVQVDVSPAHSHLQQHLKQLESKRGAISSRRAYLRNQRELCVQAHEQQQHSVVQRSEQLRQHHTAQLKREKRRAEEEQMKQWVENERAKTLNRVRSFRERHQGQYALQTAHVKPVSHDSSRDDSSQPLSIINLGPQSSTPHRKRRSQKQRDIPVQILLPPGSASAQPDQTPPAPPNPPPLLPPPPPPPPLPPPPPAPPISAKLPVRNTLEQNSGSMDELLASLQRGQTQLRKVTVSAESGDVRNSLLSAIRQGVTLKKVPPSSGPTHSSDSELERSIKAAMIRMKKVSNDSDDEEPSDAPSGDWES
ncbi:WASP homolog-associated protein with actin, membranes and microtubules isoform X1 [Sinocyclocheilus grahami]|uniref:WASP homolog-associated protein with actin, membranes and microtubules isoform X1 n=1 Tax=Sinocyclocheilus grahami TaxID=75366 RepID=UPI0007AC9D81|nr:PREDICTED: WASP homolog-associated protein with actin, membranes and microtubules-like isoform X1 [Sinocyclocheilus grahami]